MEFLVPDDFYRVAHQLIFAAMIELNQNSEAIDPITVSEKLRQKNQIDNVVLLSFLIKFRQQPTWNFTLKLF